MRNRTTRRASGLVLIETDRTTDRRTIEWTYESNRIGTIRGELEYPGRIDNGWVITGLPLVSSDFVTFWLIPLPLKEAVEKIEERLRMAEREAGRFNPEEQRVEAELDELFDG
jgi:hypothetical protein